MPSKYRAKIRMYRHGLGDCFLLTFPGTRSKPFHMVIDCGVILGTKDSTDKMKAVVDDIESVTKGVIDVLAVTHEHWDHVSGFLQVEDWASRFDVKQVWFGWTEDPDDELARELDRHKDKALATLMKAAGHMRLSGMGAAAKVDSILGFYGIGSDGLGAAGTMLGARSTRDARDMVRELGPVVYRRPGDVPVRIGPAKGPLVYVLGPPHDEKKIKRYAPSRSQPETYELSAADPAAALDRAFETYDEDAPFGLEHRIPLDHAGDLPFFRDRYWGQADIDDLCSEYCHTRKDPKERETNLALLDQAWRRIDDAWLGVSPDLALKLDSATNNTSLVLAIELEPGGDVLLFAGDAQVGNWLSWHDVKWEEDGKTVTGTDLLKRTLLYKVGHHGSHNATLKEQGLELMDNPDLIALVPVDHEMAVKKSWDEIPRPSLMKRLHEKARGRVLSSDDGETLAKMHDPTVIDEKDWKAFTKQVKVSTKKIAGTDERNRPLWYEVTV
jgi:hypothetical protein